MNLWLVSMECAGISEAGGVKNVTFSLCKEFSELGNKVTLFIPVFKCTTWDSLKNIEKYRYETKIFLCGKNEVVSYTTAVCVPGNFNVVFINHQSFAEKEGVYTYTENEQKQNSEFKKGEGHKDLIFKDILFQKSVAAYYSFIDETEYPDIVHCQDASTAVLPAFIKYLNVKKKAVSVVTIHNAGPYYHHEFKNVDEAHWYTELSYELLQSSKNGERVEPFLIAAECGANISTVSEAYAQELCDPANSGTTDGLSQIFSAKKIFIKGITNGFDFDRYDPSDIKVSKLPFAYSPETGDMAGKYANRKVFLETIAENNNFSAEGIKKIGFLKCNSGNEVFIAYHGRVTTQKGIAVLIDSVPVVLNNNPEARFVIAGQGESALEEGIKNLTEKFPGKIIFLNGYNQSVVRLVTAVCDFIVLPSYFEPCGLEDFIAQGFGTLPIAHKTGGLNKILDGETGFLYNENTCEKLSEKVNNVIKLSKNDPDKIKCMVQKAALSVHEKYLWKNVVKNEYLNFFKEILKKIDI